MPPLPRPIQVAAVVMTALAVGLFIAFWGLRVWLEKSGLSERIGHAVAERATDVLGQPVHVGSVGLRGLNGIVLHDVLVDEPGGAGEPGEPHIRSAGAGNTRSAGFRFAAEQVLVGIDPRILWEERGRDPASAVLAVKFIGATIDLPQRPDGSWALPRLPLPRSAAPPPGDRENPTWDGRIDIVQSSVRLAGRDFELALERIEGTVRRGDVHLSGQADLNSKALALHAAGLFHLAGAFSALDQSYSGSLAIKGGLLERLTGNEPPERASGARDPDGARPARFQIPGDLAIAFHGAGPTLILDRWELPGFGGRLTGRAQAGLDSGRFAVSAGGEKLDPAQVLTGLRTWLPNMGAGSGWSGLDRLPGARAVSGEVTAEGAADWRLQRINGSVALSSLEAGALLLDSVSVTGSWAAAAPGELRIAQASARRGKAAASVGGVVRFDRPDQSLDLEVRASNIEPRTWAALARWPVEGRFDLDGHITGGFQAPRFAGTISGGPGSLWSRPFQALTASLTASRRQITLAPLKFSGASGNVTANGSIGFPASPTGASLALDVVATDLPVDAIAPGSKLPIEGPLSGNLQIRGTAAAPEVSGSMQARAVAWAGQRLEGLSVTGRFAASDLIVDQALGTWRGVRVRASGRVDGIPSPAPVLALAVEAGDLPLAAVAEALALPEPWRPAGSAAVSARVTGTWPAAAVTAQASGNEWAWRGMPFDGPVVTANWAAEGWNGTLRARGFDRPLRLAAAGDRTGPRRLAFTVDQGELTAAIGSRSDPIEVAARAFPAEWLVPLLPENTPLTPGGALNGRFTIVPPGSGPGGDPATAPAPWSGRGEFDLGSLRVGPAELTAIRGQLALGNSVLTLSSVAARLAGRDIQIDGSVPLAASSAPGNPPQLDLSIRAPEGPLPAPGGLFPKISALNLSGGSLGAEVHVGGTLAAPRVDGNARLRGLAVAYPGLPGPLGGVNADVAFNGNRIQFSNLSAQMLGGSLTGAGVVLLPEAEEPGQRSSTGSPTARDARLDFRLRADNVRYSDPMVTATVSGDLALSGPVGFPTVRGRLFLAKGTFKLASRPSGPAGSKPAFDPALDVYLVPQDVRVNLPGVDVLASGELRARGRLSRPTLSGQIAASRGTLNYLGTTFTIQRAVADFADYRGALPRIDLSANTSIGRTGVTLTLSGTADALQTEFTTDPPMDRNEVFGLLGIPSAIHRLGESDSMGDVSQEVLRIVDDGLQTQVIGNLERAVRDALALDDFRLSPSLRDWRLGVHLGKTVLPNVYVSYERMLDSSGDRNWSVEYQLTPQLKMTSRFGGQDSWMGLEASWRF